MRTILMITIVSCLFGHVAAQRSREQSYSWFSLEVVKKDAQGKLTEKVK